MQETQNDLKLLGGRVNSLECVYKDKSGFDYSFSLDEQILNVRWLQSPLLPVKAATKYWSFAIKRGGFWG